MEHLIYRPSERAFRREIRAIAKALEDGDWTSLWRDEDQGTLICADLRFAWLGHDHAASSWYHHPEMRDGQVDGAFPENYGQGWAMTKVIDLGNMDLRVIHPSLRDMTSGEEVVHEVAAFMQSWALMGLMEFICERPIPQSLFVRGEIDSGGKETSWINTRYLPAFLEAWKARLDASSLTREEVRARLRQARTYAMNVWEARHPVHYSRIVEDDNATTVFSSFREALSAMEPALAAVSEAIIAYTSWHLGESGAVGLHGRFTLEAHWQRLVLKGWCPYLIWGWQRPASMPFLRYLDAAGYTLRLPDGAHDECDGGECKRDCIDVDTPTYTQSHSTPRCRCNFLSPDLRELFKILDDGLIPVVRFDESTSRLEVAAAPASAHQIGVEFIAFSHVWLNGLGSTSEKGLPRCQIQHLQVVANRAVPDRVGVWFWIDGLCIPRRKSYRREAIRSMNSIYRNAVAVIVYEHGIQTVSSSAPEIEIAWNVVASAWMRRMWTFLEGYISSRLFLALSDSLVDLDLLVLKIHNMLRLSSENATRNPFPSILLQKLLSSLTGIRHLRGTSTSNSNNNVSTLFTDLFNAMMVRRTSRADDQLLVAELFFNLDLSLLNTNDDQNNGAKWISFYVRLRDIPWCIVFDPRPKLVSTPFRWAIRSWLYAGHGERPIPPSAGLGTCTKEGLRARLTVLKLNRACDVPDEDDGVLVTVAASGKTYDLNRTPDFEISSAMTRFNTLIVKYPGNTTPEDELDRAGSTWTEVGLAYRSRSDDMGYDFSRAWGIKLLEELYEEDTADLPKVAGSWEEAELLFT